ncbi:YEATS domain-containing protein 2 [Musca vetustissima]|uniref:YEATS domain-containing protein 2 n=1 Tax=Musca vetustissima TaxID=27455 RepID=UPI002AB7BB19|nr:YEATS domain-containing protein 2 [Musca vetustissima]
MFSGQSSPRKRKHCEFHDPDYAQAVQTTCDDESTNPENSIVKRQKQETLQSSAIEKNQECIEKVRQIIEREFNSELAFKQQQLFDIDERLEKARCILDKLRYALVSAYYKKQDLPLAAVTTSAVRSAQPLFSREDKGPQMQIHPSLKKLIGKKPKDLSDVIRSCPKRTAAQNAVQTIRAKSEIQKKEERKLKQLIRGQGIVIDHSTNDDKRADVAALLNAAQLSKNALPKSVHQPQLNTGKGKQGKALNSSRLNNKEKHLFVVGNTSKFIGSEQDRDPKNKSQILTHKWLVYVQTKNSTVPLEKFVKKVRFHLHHSYRPNDIVDVLSPPFHVARRGWGEFPIRVQLFFHEEFNQKPIQLLHTVVLDKTLSGIQTLGAETLLEVWLRNTCSMQSENKNDISASQADNLNEANAKTCQVPSTEELVDDNLLEFLNKIEASHSISADIEKIQPTFVISETNPCKSPVKTTIPIKPPSPNNPNFKASLGNDVNIIPHIPNASQIPEKDPIPHACVDNNTKEMKNDLPENPPNSNHIKIQTLNDERLMNNSNSKQQMVMSHNPTNLTTDARNSPLFPHKNTASVTKDGKIIMPINSVASIVRRTILPVMNTTRNVSNTYTTSLSPAGSPNIHAKTPPIPAKQILQKKLVQLVDSTGNVKYMQMLVATSSTSPTTKAHESSTSMAPKLLASTAGVHTSSAFNPTAVPKTTPTPTMKPNIFKIVPENMQTKPQVVTFSTKSTTPTTTTLTSTVSNTNMIKQMQTISSKQNIPSSKIAPKPNGGSSNKNVVFHKEGKLYIIDPLQMKFKQQQKKQVSLLKPQVSLLKQQLRQQNETTVTNMPIVKSRADHDYTPPLKTCVQTNSPQVHYGLKQQRLNTLNIFQLMQMKRILFEKNVLRQQFTNMQNAVEFILRRLKLIAPKDSLVSAFPFVSNTNEEFQLLTAFKQRTHEWLRAKHISLLMRSHKDLQHINNANGDTFWTTKEIATFARQYAYTPDIKSLPKLNAHSEQNSKDFKELVKGELKQKEITTCDTLSDCRTIIKWIENIWPVLISYQHAEEENQTIDVDGINDENYEIVKRAQSHKSGTGLSVNECSKNTYLSPPTNLQNECSLLMHICKDLSIQLDHEEISPNIWNPSVQIILSHSLNIFLQKIIRGVISLKNQENASSIELVHTIQPADIAKVLSKLREFDFLTNSNFGTNSKVDLYTIKQEKS